MEDSTNNELNLLNLSSSKEDLSLLGNATHNSLNKSVQSITKPIRRLQSLPLKTFKVTNPQKSEILSIICDNIFEDIIINEDVNLSMIKLKSEINIKNTLTSSKKVLLEKAKTVSTDKLNIKNEVDEEFDIPQISRPHKKSFIFNNILKIKNIKCPRLLEEQWKYEKILLDYNIIDFTSKKI